MHWHCQLCILGSERLQIESLDNVLQNNFTFNWWAIIHGLKTMTPLSMQHAPTLAYTSWFGSGQFIFCWSTIHHFSAAESFTTEERNASFCETHPLLFLFVCFCFCQAKKLFFFPFSFSSCTTTSSNVLGCVQTTSVRKVTGPRNTADSQIWESEEISHSIRKEARNFTI